MMYYITILRGCVRVVACSDGLLRCAAPDAVRYVSRMDLMRSVISDSDAPHTEPIQYTLPHCGVVNSDTGGVMIKENHRNHQYTQARTLNATIYVSAGTIHQPLHIHLSCRIPRIRCRWPAPSRAP